MNPLEAMMWRAEVDPRLRSNVMVVGVLDTAPDWERLVAAHEWATRLIPRLRQRVVEPAFGLGIPSWEVVEHLDLDAHLRRMRVAGGVGLRELLDTAAERAMPPFDRARPLWDAVLVEGMEDGRAGYLLKLHHTLADGVGLVQLMSLLASTTREHTPDKPEFPVPEPDTSSRPALLVGQLLRRLSAVPSTLLGTARTAAGWAGQGVTHPWATVSDAAAFTGSVLRAATPPAVEGSALLAARSGSWHFETLDVPLPALKAAGSTLDASLNDAFLAALLGAYRRYHEHFGVVPAEIPIGMPVNLRARGDAPGGNRWAGTRFAVPLAEPDPARRMLGVREAVRAVVNAPVVDGIGLVAPLLARLPPPVLARIQGGATSGNDLQASNVPGVADPVYLAGAQLVRVYPFAPLSGCAATVALTSHHGTCCVAANIDPAAITETEVFARCLQEGFDEVLDLAR